MRRTVEPKQTISMICLIFLALLALSAVPSLALARDGVLEINQSCAVIGGCFSGDSAGFPVTIDGSAGRSYLLSGDLLVPDADTDAIHLSSSNISIDLNGFRIIGPSCVGATSNSCVPSTGDGSGIEVDNTATRFGTSVTNGSIIGMGRSGVRLGPQSRVTRLRVRWNRLAGIDVRAGSTVSGCITYQNGLTGIWIGVGSTASGNTAYNDGLEGIFAEDDSTVSGNTVYQSGINGISASSGVAVLGNTTYGTGRDGINAGAGSLVQSNTAFGNARYGLRLNATVGYGGNVVTNNTMGSVFRGSTSGTMPAMAWRAVPDEPTDAARTLTPP